MSTDRGATPQDVRAGSAAREKAGPGNGGLPAGGAVDSHAHAYLQDMPLIPNARWTPGCDRSAEEYLGNLDRCGISYGVLVAHSAFGAYADYALEAMRRHDRLRATCILEPDVSPERLRQLDRGGMVGMRFMGLGYGLPDIESPDYTRLLGRLADMGWHVHIYAEGEAVARALPVLLRSGVRVAVDHFGHPTAEKGLDSPGFQAALRALDSGRAWIKLSGAFRFSQLDPLPLAERLLAAAGPERLLWGSDWPFTRFEDKVRLEDTVKAFERWVPDARVRARIHATAREFYGFGA